jgi:ATP-dependent helicase/nuclease subunit B
MKLVFGLEADGRTYPDFPGGKSAVLGEAVVGPRGLIGVLETQLGLTGPSKAEAVRIAAYAAKLAAAKKRRPTAFFAVSFDKDPWSTAARLLKWRDDLVLNGWSCSSIGAERIDDLAAAEAAPGEMPLGYADRHAVVLRALREKPSLGIGEIDFIDPPGNLPPHIIALLNALRGCGIALNQRAVGQPAATGNDLSIVSQYLLKPRMSELKGDGSFTILRSDTALMASEAVAEWLAAETEDTLAETVVICADGDSALLDQALRARGLPTLGESASSPWRGALQVLPLAFGIVWKPFNPKPLMELLLLPRPPIGRFAARKLAFALSQEPGIGGKAWMNAWAAIEEKENEREKDQPGAKRTVDDRLKRWREWSVGGLFERDTGIPADDARRIANRVAQWAIKTNGRDNDPLLLSVAGAASALVEAINAIEMAVLPALLVERMIEQVIAEGATNPGHIATAGGLRSVRHPGAIWGSAKRIIWWNFSGPGERVNPPADPWTVAEVNALEKAGCLLGPTLQAAQRVSYAYTNAVYRAQECLMLVRPALSGDDETTGHPLAHQLAPLLNEFSAKVNWTAEQLLRQPKATLGRRELKRRAVVPLPLPKQRKLWDLPSAAMGRIRDRRESATGLEHLVDCQLRWLLQDVLRLSRGRFAEIPDTNQLLGNLAHEIAANLFKPGEMPDKVELAAEADRLFDQLADAIAAPLHQPENSGDFVRARSLVPGSLAHLGEFIRNNRLEVIGTELERRRDIGDMKVGGRLDMLVQDSKGALGVIDLKWTRSVKRRREEVQKGTAIQLATYSAIADETGMRPASGAYYMLGQKQLIGERGSLVSETEINADKTLAQTWTDIQTTWRIWRDRALDGKAFAGGIDGPPDPPDGIAIPASEEPCKYCDYSGLCRISSQEA